MFIATLCAVLLALTLTACDKSPKQEAKVDRAKALEEAKKGPFGTQVKAHEDAKKLGEEMNKKVEEGLKGLDEQYK